MKVTSNDLRGKSIELQTYTIYNRLEETQCNNCGYPLYIDDKAFQSEDSGDVYCSKKCAAESEL